MTVSSRRTAPILALGALLLAWSHPAVAEPMCERKCFKAETCPIAGLKCLTFDVCRDVCSGGADSSKDDEAPSLPMLPGPADDPKREI